MTFSLIFTTIIITITGLIMIIIIITSLIIITTITGLLIIIIISRFAEPTWESLLVIASLATAGNLTGECAKVGFLRIIYIMTLLAFFCFVTLETLNYSPLLVFHQSLSLRDSAAIDVDEN